MGDTNRRTEMRASFFTACRLVLCFLAVETTCGRVSRAGDDLAGYVWQKARESLTQAQVAVTGQKVGGEFRVDYTRYDKKRRVLLRDSASGEAFGHDGVIDSFVVTSGTAKLLAEKSFSWPDLLHAGYRANFFPHDTGGAVLSLNLDLDTAHALLPVGILNIDRTTYRPLSAYLALPVDRRTKRHSRRVNAVVVGGGIYPGELRDVVVESGVLSEENYEFRASFRNLHLR